MTTVTRPSRLCGWSVRRASIVLALAFCASAFADADKDVVLPAKPRNAQKRILKVCYVKSTVSGIPQRCDRFGGIPTNAIPMDLIGQSPTK